MCGKNRVDVQRPKIAEKSVIFFPTEGRKRKDYFSVFGKTASCQEQSKLPNKMREKLLYWKRRGEGRQKHLN